LTNSDKDDERSVATTLQSGLNSWYQNINFEPLRFSEIPD